MEALSANLLHNDSSAVATHLLATHPVSYRADIVLDNAGFEVFSDMCLAHVLLTSGCCKTVVFHAKAMPWFVSDVTAADFHWTLNRMLGADDFPHSALQMLGKIWSQNLTSGVWQLKHDKFFTLPHDFTHMQRISPDLHEHLSKSRLIVFKGDLNYRKLLGDRKWPHDTPFRKAMCGFLPASVLALRTLKSDCLAGVEQARADAAAQTRDDWMICNTFGVIMFEKKLGH